MEIVKQFLNNREYKLPINLYKFNPCREWVLLKMNFTNNREKVALIMNELNYRGISVEETAGMLTKIMQLSEKNSVERVVEIMERYAKSKRADSEVDESV
jgi:hypothetical protein